jgi:hypothetical protein
MSIPCPFVYANGSLCSGRIIRVEAYKADVVWEEGKSGAWLVSAGPRSHYHLFCSEKGNHAGSRRSDSPQMKFYWRQLPRQIQDLIEGMQAQPKDQPPA